MPIKVTSSSFISRSIQVHGNLYDYSLVEYIDNKTKVKINCPSHGVFEQLPTAHTSQKSGCPICALEKKQQQGKDRVAQAASEFVSKAQSIHGDKYDYSLVNYTGNKNKVTILCPVHGSFEQTPHDHLKGHGCPLCSGAKAKQATAKSEFATKANIIHNNKYSYELVEYKGAITKVNIICTEHGIFEQRPDNHLRGQGCPTCAKIERSQNTGWTRTSFKEKCEKNNNGLGILYILGCWSDDKSEVFIKIGITSLSIKKRYCSKASMPYNYKVLHEITGNPEYIYNLETLLHKKSKNYKYTPTTYFAGSITECFEVDKDYLTNLNNHMNELIPF